MATYGLQKALKWFEKNNGNIKIETDTMQLKFSLNAGVAPHLLGLQYMKIIENQVLLQGKELFEHIKKNFYSDQEIFEKIIENSQRGYGHEFNKRNTSLQKFFENLEESKLVENTIESEFLKNEFFLIIKNQETDGSITCLNLGLEKTKTDDNKNVFHLNSFFKRVDDEKYYKGTKIEESVVSISKFNNDTRSFEPFTFKGKELSQEEIDIIDINGKLKDLIKSVNCNYLKHDSYNAEENFKERIKFILKEQQKLENDNTNRLTRDYIKQKIPIIDTIDENILIKRKMKEISNFENFIDNKEKDKTYIDIKKTLLEQEKLEVSNSNLYKSEEVYDSINDFFDKIVDDKNAYFIQKMLINDKLPDDFIKHFEKTFATELDNCKKTFIEQKNIQKDRQEIEK